ncbi:MAG TPA: NHL repeat-containing protein [Mucilaginibacter sp.]|jgi:sugar lactone lactonase YvrE
MKIIYLRNIYLSSFILLIAVLTQGCKKTNSTSSTQTPIAPTVTTISTIINVTSTTAESGGVITSIGNAAITEDGICYSSTNATPTTSDTKLTAPVASNQLQYPPFISNLTGLTPNTTYYVRAYAHNTAGAAYGSVVKFTTSASLTAITTQVITFAGNGTAGYADASGLSAQFNNPEGITIGNNGNLYVSDSYNGIIREVTPAGAVSTVAGTTTIGYTDGAAATAQFYAPHGSAFDAQGNLYVADFGNNVIRKITPAGIVSTYAGNGTAGYRNGAATSANLTGTSDTLAVFNNPQAVAVDANGNVYVADRGNNVIRKILTTGRVVTLAGHRTAGYVDATGASAAFDNPSGLVVDGQGNVFVSDQANSAIRKITTAGAVSTIAGGNTQATLLNFPSAIAIDKTGNLFIVDEGGRIFEYTTASVLYNLAGTANTSGFVNGAGTSALFNNPQGIAVDANGNIYVADQYNNCIRKITVTLTN